MRLAVVALCTVTAGALHAPPVTSKLHELSRHGSREGAIWPMAQWRTVVGTALQNPREISPKKSKLP